MKSNLASGILTVLLYTQGLLGFAGLTTIVLKDWPTHEPVFVNVAEPAGSQYAAR